MSLFRKSKKDALEYRNETLVSQLDYANKSIIAYKEEIGLIETRLEGKYKDKINSLKNDITQIQFNYDELDREFDGKYVKLREDCDEAIRKENIQADIKIEKATKDIKAEFDKEYKTKFTELETNAKKLQTNLSDVTGKYEGSLEIIKVLKQQVADTMKLNSEILKALPTVSAELSSTDQTVTVNN